MASPRCLIRPVREISFRARPQVSKRKLLPIVQSRFASDDTKVSQVPPGSKGPNEDQLPHVSEEQAAMDKSMGNTPPDIDQGTPVKEILKDDKEALKNAPQVIKDQVKSQSGTGQKRSYSTSARRMGKLAQVPRGGVIQNGMVMGMEYPDAGPGHKFPLPDVNELPRLSHLRRRYDPVLDQMTKAIMRHGKLSVAQKTTAQILDILRTSPAPNLNPGFPGRTLIISDNATATPFVGGLQQSQSPFGPPAPNPSSDNAITSLPRSTLPLHPIEYLTTIIDSVSPLVKIRQQRGIAGGGASLPIPVPLGVRQRRRQAIQWILNAADGRKETHLADRVAKELVRVAEGSSGVWERRAMVHRLGVSARSNVRSGMMKRRK